MIVDIKIYYYSVFGKGNISLEFQGEIVPDEDILSKP